MIQNLLTNQRTIKSIFTSRIYCLFILFGYLTSSAAITWQTTRNAISTGRIKISDYSIQAKAFPFHLNVTEEVVLSDATNTTFTDITGETLEIIGTFKLPKGAALRGVLLWQDDLILKAWLVDKIMADSLYEDAVQREDMSITTPIDPILIHYEANGVYNFSIYPLASGGNRKLRLLYSILPEVNQRPDSLAYDIRPSFIFDNSNMVNEIRYSFTNEGSQQKFLFGSSFGYTYYRNNYFSTDQAMIRPLEWESLYIHPGQNDQYMGYHNADLIWKNLTKGVYAFTKIESGNKAGCYSWMHAKRPRTLSDFLDSSANLANYSLEISGTMNGQQYYRPINIHTKWVKLLKKESQCIESGITHWRILDNSDGGVLIEGSDSATILTPKGDKDALPLLWAANYSLVEEKENLGVHYGFADKQMSYLALEEFALPSDEAAKYAFAGVPLLKDEEIVASDGFNPEIPETNLVIKEGTFVIPQDNTTSVLNALPVQLFNDIIVNGDGVDFIVGAASGYLSLKVVDINGRIINKWLGNVQPAQKISIDLHQSKPGVFWIIASLDGKVFRQSFQVTQTHFARD